jgi:hypothetical protein
LYVPFLIIILIVIPHMKEIRSRIKIRIRSYRFSRLSPIFAILLLLSAYTGLAAESELSGMALAERLRSAEPEESSEIHGTLITHAGKLVTHVPVDCRVVLKGATWETVYETSATTNIGGEKLVVVHRTNGPNEYLYARASGPGAAPGNPSPIPIADADIPLAGSDFTLTDLGLEFLHWPRQQRLRDETKMSQACYVLESSNPNGREFVRVRSDIDQETGGLLTASAFDADGHKVMEFSLSGFKKVNGHWRLEKMEIHDYKLRSRTELKFDISQ